MIVAEMLPDRLVRNIAGEHVFRHDLPEGIILDPMILGELLHLRLLIFPGKLLEGGV